MAHKIIGLIATVILIFIVLYMYFMLAKNRKTNYKIAIIIAVVLCISITVLAYQILPIEGKDLYYYYNMLDGLKEQSLSDVFSNFQYKDTPVTALWFWVVAQIGNYNLINSVPAMITILCLSYVFIDVIKTKQISVCDTSLTLFFLLGFISFVMLMTSVRYPLSVSLVSLGIYLEIYKDKNVKQVAWLYLLAFMIHDGIILLLVVYLLHKIFKDKYYAKYALVFIGFFLILIQQAVTIVNINNNVYQRIVRYLVPTYYDWRRALANTMLIIILVMVYYFVKKHKTSYYRNKADKNAFLEYLLMFSLGVSVCPELLDRLLIPVIVLSFPVVLEYFNLLKTNVNCTSNKNSYRLMYYISVFVFIVGTSFMWAYQFAMWKSWRLICL